MRFTRLLLLSCIVVSANAVYVVGDGQPGCRTQEELKVQLYRNLWDPSAFWKCTERNVPASSVQCPDGTAFLNSAKDCVEWDKWQWEEPVPPPSKPKIRRKQ